MLPQNLKQTRECRFAETLLPRNGNVILVSLLDIVFLHQMFAWLRAKETMLAEIQDVSRYQTIDVNGFYSA